MTSLGIDIGGSSIKCAATRDGQTLWTRRSGQYRQPSRAQLVAALREAAGDLSAPYDAVGLCLPGLLDRPNRRVTLSINVPALTNEPLDAVVADALGALSPRATLLTDAHAAAYDIYASSRFSGRLLLLVLGTGVGAAVWDESGPLHVDGESPGHLGQMDVSLEDEIIVGQDGGAGSLEAYLGTAALRGRYGDDFVAKLPTLSVDEAPLRALARAIRIAHAIYRPHHVCLAGGIGNALGPTLPILQALINKDLTRIARPGWTLTCGNSDYHAALGAAGLAVASART